MGVDLPCPGGQSLDLFLGPSHKCNGAQEAWAMIPFDRREYFLRAAG